MPTLTFIEAKPTNSDKEGLNILFIYKVDDATQSRTIHVLGAETSWGMNEQQKVEYMQKLFTGTLAYVKHHWETYGELPDTDKQLDSQSDFPPYQPGPTAWEGYTLQLVD
ncbi:hypothetical protein [Spirosoma fluviale]|uniref:Uncharacterized protein n=1 Tax=Spirosoma fluviale TaxID=1597977 RepID=A0A286GQ98_9BACT|nr:hypothetical protein [Spirosoma fluviale]SOD97731.1 hypothetical protein SAMN06269250_5901 [Spirosoma fluviale]